MANLGDLSRNFRVRLVFILVVQKLSLLQKLSSSLESMVESVEIIDFAVFLTLLEVSRRTAFTRFIH